MTDTPNLGLPYIEAAQAQKHVTHNEALRMLDALVMLSVLDRDLSSPPISPAEGDRYLVKSPGADDFAGMDDRIAHYVDGGWTFHVPHAGWVCYVRDEETLIGFDGEAWISTIDLFGGVTELQNLNLLGVGTGADASNPFAAKLNNALWGALTEAEGGDGSLRYKLSKESAAKTLSLLFQDNFSGRAEIGLTGDDDFHFKVSADGSSWYESVKIDRATGKVSFPVSGGPREQLAANRTYFVRTDGSDSNDGLTDSAGGAFLTVQKAIDVVAALDISIYDVTIQVRDGTFTDANVVNGPWIGSGTVTIQGNSATPSNVVLGSGSNTVVYCQNGGRISVGDLQVTGSIGLYATLGGSINFNNLDFGACAAFQIRADDGGRVTADGDYTISGGASEHIAALSAGIVRIQNKTVTLSGTPAFSSYFAEVLRGGVAFLANDTFSGSALGVRYSVTENGVITVGAAGASYLPGDAAGSTATGGQYN
jgi:hypothetical protein